MQMYFHQEQVDMKRIQEIVKRSEIQAVNVEGRIRNHLTSQEKTLEERIRSRKKRSDAGMFIELWCFRQCDEVQACRGQGQ